MASVSYGIPSSHRQVRLTNVKIEIQKTGVVYSLNRLGKSQFQSAGQVRAGQIRNIEYSIMRGQTTLAAMVASKGMLGQVIFEIQQIAYLWYGIFQKHDEVVLKIFGRPSFCPKHFLEKGSERTGTTCILLLQTSKHRCVSLFCMNL